MIRAPIAHDLAPSAYTQMQGTSTILPQSENRTLFLISTTEFKRLESLIESMAGVSIQPSEDQRSSVSNMIPLEFADSQNSNRIAAKLGDAFNLPLGKQIFEIGSSIYVDPSTWIALFDQVSCDRFIVSIDDLSHRTVRLSNGDSISPNEARIRLCHIRSHLGLYSIPSPL